MAARSPRRWDREHLLDAACVLAAVAVYAALVRRFWFVTDDAYITFRFARNLARGFGPRFNLGEAVPVEGYSSFLWMLACAAWERLGLNAERWPLLLSATCGVALLVLVFRSVRERLACPRWIACAAVLAVAAHVPFAVWATGGLETMLFVLLLFVACERWILRAGGIEPVSAGLAALALALVRVEGMLWAGLIAGLALLSRQRAGEPWWKAWRRGAAILVLGFGAYYAWRTAYYRLPFPNTVYAKSELSAATLARGLDYVVIQFLSQPDLWITLAAIPVALRRERLAIGLPLVTLVLAFYGYAVLVGGDFMAMGRFVVPAWPLTALLFAWLLADLAGSGGARKGAAVALASLVPSLGLLPATGVELVPVEARATFDFRGARSRAQYLGELEYWAFQKDDAKRYGVKGRALRHWVEPDARVVLSGIGAVGYYSDLFLFDQHGLVNHEAAVADFTEYWAARGRTRTAPGHDRLVPPSFFYEHEPEVIFVQVFQLVDEPVDPRRQLRRDAFVPGLRGFEQTLREAGLRERYVVDFRPIPDWEHGGPDQVLVVWRRIRRERSSAEEWADFQRRLDDFARGRGDAVATDDYPRPLSGWFTRRP